MNLAPPKSKDPDVNLTPMIDVVFLLLLFFMVSTSFIRESSLKVDLPEATGQALVEQQAIDIVINTDGSFIVNDINLGLVSKEQLLDALKIAAGDNSDPHIIISADADTEYQNIVTAMDSAQQLNFVRITLATRQTSKPTP